MARILVIECDDFEVPDVVSRLTATPPRGAQQDVERVSADVQQPPAAAAAPSASGGGWFQGSDGLVFVADRPTAVAHARECLDGSWQWEVVGRASGFAEGRDGALQRAQWVLSWPEDEVEARAAALSVGDERSAFAPAAPPRQYVDVRHHVPTGWVSKHWFGRPDTTAPSVVWMPVAAEAAVGPFAPNEIVTPAPGTQAEASGGASVGGGAPQEPAAPAPAAVADLAKPTLAADPTWAAIQQIEDPRDPKADPLLVGAGAFAELVRIWLQNWNVPGDDVPQPDRRSVLMSAFAGYGPQVGKYIRERGGLAGACTHALLMQSLCPVEDAVRVGKQLALNIVSVGTTQALPLDRLLERSLLLNLTDVQSNAPPHGGPADVTINFDVNRPTPGA